MNAPSNNGSESDPPLIDQIPLELKPRIKEFFVNNFDRSILFSTYVLVIRWLADLS